MDPSRIRGALTRWRAPVDAGAILLLGWFLLLLVRPYLVRPFQSFLLANRHLIPLLPHGIATPRVVAAALGWLGIPLATLAVLVTVLSLSTSPPPG